MLEIFQNLVDVINTQTELTQTIQSNLSQLEVGGGGGPSGTIYASNVVYDNTTSGTDKTNVQASLDEIYALIGTINSTLNDII